MTKQTKNLIQLFTTGEFGYKGIGRQVYLGYLLGIVFGLGIAFIFLSKRFWDFGIAICAISIYHMWEYTYYALFRPNELDEESFLLNHSTEYTIAIIGLFVEYFIEFYFFPQIKKKLIIVIPGLIIIIIGQILRIVSMYTAGKNFNHYIEEYKRPDHQLVTSGIYGIMRHPSYVGWFYWAIAVTMVLCNPISFLGFTGFLWDFFRDRIEFEEKELVKQFGNDYIEYRKRVRSGIPFVK